MIPDGVENKAMSLMTQEVVVRMVWRKSFRTLEGASDEIRVLIRTYPTVYARIWVPA